MKKPAIPLTEKKRVATLQDLHILDTEPEERFDRLTRIAKRLFDAPFAMVSLVDENRQWFKSQSGIQLKETSRDISFCAHAILDDKTFIVNDTAKDIRFADNPLVVGHPHYRFYAGHPLKAPNGEKIGALCIVDQKPRTFKKDDIEILQDLASMVERQLAVVQLATHDELTNISNRRGFLAMAQNSLHICARENIAASLVFMDLDKLKLINDQFGHTEGDKALTVFADNMKQVCRNSDIFARLGGDEFVVLLTNTLAQDAEVIINRQKALLENYNKTANNQYNIEFSYGITSITPSGSDSIETLLAKGDALMYENKMQKKEPAYTNLGVASYI